MTELHSPSGRVLTVADWMASLDDEGRRFADAAEGGPVDSPVPGCPGWDLGALVRHLGDVHRWAATIVRERRQERLRRDFVGPREWQALLAWYREGHSQLLEVLAATSAADVFWAWGAAPDPRSFWARRQAHETGIHRLDVEQAVRVAETAMPARIAADGIDEWLMLAPSRVAMPAGHARTLRVCASDTGDDWVVTLRQDGLLVDRGSDRAGDCALDGRADDLFAVLMNRRGVDTVTVSGDVDVLRAWREHVQFR
jgi:uncharacterized protein (TIGR03083 family)